VKRTDTDLARRVERAYMRATGKAVPRGARAWIGRLARLDPRSVSRMLAGDLPPDRIEAILDAIEEGRRAAARKREA
jgi:hypothetical protein